MKIRCLGAAKTVTGSCYIVQAGEVRFAIDCGLHQGNREIEARNLDMEPYDPENLDFVLVTHAHMDHTGLLPRLVSHGFKGPVYMTPPTRDLLGIMLLDSAHIQEMEAFWENKKRKRKGQKPVPPLYSTGDAKQTFPLFESVEYGKTFSPLPGIEATFKDAGHILGSAFIEIRIQENGDLYRIVFSGDLGRPNQLLVSDPTGVHFADHLFLESTYGNRNHKNVGSSLEELGEAIAYSYEHGEKVIIPAFAVERSQEIIYTLYLLSKQGKLPADMPIYLDSPLAIKATRIFQQHPEYLDADARELISNGDNPFAMENLHFTLTTEESMAINAAPGPAVVISASGMCNAGRVKHHLRHNLWRPGASVVFVGFQAMGTPGRKIVDGAREISVFGENIAIQAKVFTIGGFSSHAGQTQLLKWLENIQDKDTKVYLIHGEETAQDTLKEMIEARFGFSVHIPEYLEEMTLKPGLEPVCVVDRERATPHINWVYMLQETARLLGEVEGRVETLEGKPWVDQVEMRDKFLELNKKLMEISSEL